MSFLLSMMVLTVSCLIATSDAKQPHILFIVADDYGYNDVGYHQNHESPANEKGGNTTNVPLLTPNIDRLAAEGKKLENYYVQPLCSPTRGTFMTGRYPSHTGIGPNVIKPTHPYAMPKSETFMPEMLKRYRYQRHMVGKWHLGYCDARYSPTFRGFESFFGYLNGAEDYFTHVREDSGFTGLDLRNSTLRSSDTLPKAYPSASGEYSADLFVSRVRDIVHDVTSGNDSRPLFLYVPFQSVHGPLQAPQAFIDRYPSSMDASRRKYAGMVSALDHAVGQIERIFIDAGIWNQTVMVFSTDNGGPLGSANNFPLRGHKSTAWEGGVRGIAFVRGTHDETMKRTSVSPGTVSMELMHSTDWFPTFEQIAGDTDEPKAVGGLNLDGVSQWDAIAGDAPTTRKMIIHNCPAPGDGDRGGAIRVGRYKLLFDGDASMQVPPNTVQTPPPGFEPDGTLVCEPPESVNGMWLFDIEADPRECNNIVSSNATLVENILGAYDAYRETAISDLALSHGKSDPASNPKKRSDHAWGPWADRSELCEWV